MEKFVFLFFFNLWVVCLISTKQYIIVYSYFEITWQILCSTDLYDFLDNGVF